MMESLALVLAYAGFVALALAMSRHHRQVWNGEASKHTRILLRIAGAAGLVSAFAVCIRYAGWSVGPVLTLGLLSVAGAAVVLLLTFSPRIAFASGVVAALFAGVMGGYALATHGIAKAAVSSSASGSNSAARTTEKVL